MSDTPNLEFVLDAFRETFTKTERGNEIHSAACVELYELKNKRAHIAARAVMLEKVLKDLTDITAVDTDEVFAPTPAFLEAHANARAALKIYQK